MWKRSNATQTTLSPCDWRLHQIPPTIVARSWTTNYHMTPAPSLRLLIIKEAGTTLNTHGLTHRPCLCPCFCSSPYLSMYRHVCGCEPTISNEMLCNHNAEPITSRTAILLLRGNSQPSSQAHTISRAQLNFAWKSEHCSLRYNQRPHIRYPREGSKLPARVAKLVAADLSTRSRLGDRERSPTTLQSY